MSERYFVDADRSVELVLTRHEQIVDVVALDAERVELVVQHGYSGLSRHAVYPAHRTHRSTP